MSDGLKLGKTDHVADPRDLRMVNYLDAAALPPLPANFGHSNVRPHDGWGMLGNDRYGDCVLAGAAHEQELWAALGGHQVNFDTTDVLAAYTAVTGFSPTDPNTDRGTNMRAAASYRRAHGIKDTHGNAHKISAYVALRQGHATDLDYAIWLFDAAGIGIQFPASAYDQFNAGKPWDYVPGSPIEGGHYITGVAKAYGLYAVVTWGRIQVVTPRFLAHYMDEGFAYLSTEELVAGRTPEGFDLATLKRDLAAL